jgi:hypothetical protein
LVKLAENYMDKGWHIVQKGGSYWLLSAEFKKVADVTGPSGIVDSEEDIVITVEQTSLFLAEEASQALISAAEKMKLDKQLLKSPAFAKQMVDSNFPNDKNLTTIATNYSNLGRIFDMAPAFPYSENTKLEAEELYEMGYRLSERLHPSKAPRVYMDNNQNSIAVRPLIGDESSLISAVNSMKGPMSRYGVDMVNPIALTSLGEVYGVVFKEQELNKLGFDYSEVETLLTSIPTNKYVPEKVRTKMYENLSAYLMTQLVLCGDAGFHIGHMNIDMSTYRICADYTGSLFTRSIEDLTFAVDNMNVYGDVMNSNDVVTGILQYSDPSKQGLAALLPFLLTSLPKDYMNIMQSAQFTDKHASEYTAQSIQLISKLIGGAA